MDLATFLRTHQIRSQNIAWFLGAGASAAGGIPTATDMLWDFKRLLYCSAQSIPVAACADLGDQRLRDRLQLYFDAKADYPRAGSDDEYAFFFEQAYPAEADRRRYIERAVLAGTPSFGHLGIAAMMAMDRVRVVWTTNFDRLPEDAAARIFNTSSRLTVASLDTPDIGVQALNEGRWPLLGKLHGDFQSRRLKNTPAELQDQDARLRRALAETCRRFGMIVTGYSGRDGSVMDAFSEAIDAGRGFPAGLFWLYRSGSDPLPRVKDLVRLAEESGIDAHLIPVVTFDELVSDLLKLQPSSPPDVQKLLTASAGRITDAPLPPTDGAWPVVRLNALRLDGIPASCRLVRCEIGGSREVRDAVKHAEVPLIVARREAGVLVFGRDVDVRAAFAEHKITGLDLHSIAPRRLRYNSAELGMLYDALGRALERERPLIAERRRSEYVVRVDESRSTDGLLEPLRRAAKHISGTVPGTKLKWAEAFRMRLEYHFDALWLVYEPMIWAERTDDDEARHTAKTFGQSRVNERFNAAANAIVAAWAEVLTAGNDQTEIRSFGIGDGVDATFTIQSTTAFSHREQVIKDATRTAHTRSAAGNRA